MYPDFACFLDIVFGGVENHSTVYFVTALETLLMDPEMKKELQ